MGRFIQIVEVGPRDGLQNEKAVLTPAVRADFVRRLEAAGAKRIEAVSFVHPKYVPQMAGAEEVMAALPPAKGHSRIGLVLNGKGYDRALGTAVDEANVAAQALYRRLGFRKIGDRPAYYETANGRSAALILRRDLKRAP